MSQITAEARFVAKVGARHALGSIRLRIPMDSPVRFTPLPEAARSLETSEALERQQAAEAVAAPARDAVTAAGTRIRQIEEWIRTQDVLDRWDGSYARVGQLRELASALDDWKSWAIGKPLPLDRIATMASILRTAKADHVPACEPLADVVDRWAQTKGIDLEPAAVPEPVGLNIGIDLS